MDHASLYFILAVLFCFLMNFGVGANDLANVMSTTMGSKAVTVRQAMCIAIIFEFAGALLGGADVTETMRDGIIHTSELMAYPGTLVEGMLGILVACTIWMNLASFIGVPVSITNALVGSMVGFGCLILGSSSVQWRPVSHIAIGWLTSPLIAGVSAYLLISSIQWLIFTRRDPLQAAKRWLPVYLFLVGAILSFITVFKGLRHFDMHLNYYQRLGVMCGSSLITVCLGLWLMRHVRERDDMRRRDRFVQVEKYFGILMGMTACAMVFAHGANDVSLTVAPLTIIHSLMMHGHENIESIGYPLWIVFLGCSGVILGFLVYGRRVIETVGSSITALTPSRAFAATLAAATTVVMATSFGIPVSATQTLVGAVLGVGLARGIGALNLIVIRNIFTSWILTLPAASFLTIISYQCIHAILCRIGMICSPF